MKPESTPSPYTPQPNQKTVSREQFEKIKKMLGVDSLLIVLEEKSNDCTGDACLGHFTFFRSTGFNWHNIAGIGTTMIDYAEQISNSHKDAKD